MPTQLTPPPSASTNSHADEFSSSHAAGLFSDPGRQRRKLPPARSCGLFGARRTPRDRYCPGACRCRPIARPPQTAGRPRCPRIAAPARPEPVFLPRPGLWRQLQQLLRPRQQLPEHGDAHPQGHPDFLGRDLARTRHRAGLESPWRGFSGAFHGQNWSAQGPGGDRPGVGPIAQPGRPH